MTVVDQSCRGHRRGDERNGGGYGVSREIDDRNRAVRGLSADRRDTGASLITCIDDVGAGAVLQDTDHARVDPDRNGGDDGAEADRVDWVVGIAVGVGDLRG